MEYKFLTEERQQEIIDEIILQEEEAHFRNSLWKTELQEKLKTCSAKEGDEITKELEVNQVLINKSEEKISLLK